MLEKNPDYILVNKAFPHIGKKIRLFWGNPEFASLIDDLQRDTRSARREGFPGEVLIALSILDSLHQLEFPALARRQSDVWKPDPV